MPEDPQAPAAQVDVQTAASDSGAIPPSSDASSSTPGAQAIPASNDVTTRVEKLEQDLRVTYGREAANARRQAAEAHQVVTQQAQTIARLEQHLTQLSETVAREQQIKDEAMLAILPPEQRAEHIAKRTQKEVEALRQRINGTAGAQPQPAARPAQQGLTQEQVAARAREIASEVATRYNVVIEYDDIPQAAWQSEKAFRDAVERVGRIKSSAKGSGEPVAKNQSGSTSEIEQLRNEVNSLKKQLGTAASGPNSASPVAPLKPGQVTDEHFRKVNASYDSRKGPRPNRAELEKLRDAARAALPS